MARGGYLPGSRARGARAVLAIVLGVIVAGVDAANVCDVFAAPLQFNLSTTLDPSTGLYSQQPSQCFGPGPFVPFDGRCYVSSMSSWSEAPALSWTDAQAVCLNYGANLASIFTLRENCFIWGSLPGARNDPMASGVYLPPFTGTRYNQWNVSYEPGVTFIGLAEAIGTNGGQVAWAEGPTATYDPVPTRNGGSSPWGGNDDCCAPYYDFNIFYYDFPLDPQGNPDYSSRPAWDTCNWATFFGQSTSYNSYFYGNCAPTQFGAAKTGQAESDCVIMYSRNKQGGEWINTDCSVPTPYVCTKYAFCAPGFRLTSPFVGMPQRVNASLTIGNVYPTYSTGVCTQCPPGKYHAQDGTLSIDSGCQLCNAGTFGTAGQTSPSCSGLCPPGYYCPAGTGVNNIIPCPAGTYRASSGGQSLADCTTTPSGFWTPAASNQTFPCQAGSCGFSGATTASCQAICPAGYFCGAGVRCFNLTATAAPEPSPCGANNLYSQSGQVQCSTVLAGYYTAGPSPLTRTQQVICPAGYFCPGDGSSQPCPAGTFVGTTGSITVGQCTSCTAGYYCPPGSTSSIQQPCGLIDAVNPQLYYCPQGTPVRLTVADGEYTTPVDADVSLRTGQAACNSTQVCYNGFAYPKVSWAPGSCSAMSVNENLDQPYTGRTLQINFFELLNPSDFTVEYSLDWWGFSSDHVLSQGCSWTACDPNNPDNAGLVYNTNYGQNITQANYGIFALDPDYGILTVTRTEFPNWLNYEACRCPNLQYNLSVSVVATDSFGPNVLNCTFLLTVNDVNDRPLWPPEVPGGATSYRAIVEQSPINTAVVGCDGTSYFGFNTSYFGCPFAAPNQSVYVEAWDEDFNPAIRYSVDSTYYDTFYLDPSVNPFVINACSGLISMGLDDAINYWLLSPVSGSLYRFFTVTVLVTDDGNGGRFAPLSASHTTIVYVIKIPALPVLPDPSSVVMFIKELQPAGTAVISASTVLDCQPSYLAYCALCNDPSETITYNLVLPTDSNAFAMDSTTFQLITTPVGAKSIRFESSKTTYFVTIQATTTAGTVSQSYTINVQDVNNPPAFTNPLDFFYVKMQSPDGTSVCQSSSGACQPNSAPVTTYTPEGPQGESGIVYALADDGFGLFVINETTGQIYTALGAQQRLIYDNDTYMDYSGNSQGTGRLVNVTVVATAKGIPPLVDASSQMVFAIYIVLVNQAPYFAQPSYSFYMLDTAPSNTPLLGDTEITAIDPHNLIQYQVFPNLLPKQTLTYSRSTNASLFSATNDDQGNYFGFLPGTATLILIRPLTYQNTPACPSGDIGDHCFIIWVHVQDNGIPSLGGDVPITVTVYPVNKPPYWSAPATTTISVYESVPAAQRVVVANGSFANDVDSPLLTYSVVGGTGVDLFELGSYGTYFDIAKISGVQLWYQQPIDQWTIFVQATDFGGSSWIGRSCAYLLTSSGYQATGCGAGTECLAFNSGYWCFETCLPWTNGTSLDGLAHPRRHTFFCDYLGQPTVGQPTYESTSTTFVVTINVLDDNKAPQIVNSSGVASQVPNCIVNGTIVLSVNIGNPQVAISSLQVVDPDLHLNRAPFTFTTHDALDPFWKNFTLDSATGQVTFKPITGVQLSLNETFTSYVDVTDAPTPVSHTGPLTTTCEISVSVIAHNTPPVWPSNNPLVATVPEYSYPGYVVFSSLALNGNLSLLDVDILAPYPGTDTLVFSMQSTPYFNLDPYTSALTIGDTPLVYNDLYPTFQLILVVQVTNSHGSSAVTTVTINVAEVNKAPAFNVSYAPKFSVPENAPPGTPLGIDFNSICADPDIYATNASWRTPIFEIVPGTGCDSYCHFAFPPGGAQLAVQESATGDYGSGNFQNAHHNSWTFQVKCQDGTLDPVLYDLAWVTVSLTMVPQPPAIQSGTNISVLEGSQVYYSMNFLAYDADHPSTVSFLTFSITGGNVNNAFSVANGVLQLNPGKQLDYEFLYTYTLTVTVTSVYGLSNNGIFVVNVDNVDDVTISSVVVVGAPFGSPLKCDGTAQILRFYGTNFGMVSESPTAVVTATYQRQVLPFEVPAPSFSLTGCQVKAPNNTIIECSLSGHVGQNLLFNLTISVPGTQIAHDSATFVSNLAFASPTITSVTGADLMPTTGGSSVTLTGTCFGNMFDTVAFDGIGTMVQYKINSALASPLGYRPLAIGACASAAVLTTQIVCTNASLPGLGYNLTWQVLIANQWSNVFVRGQYAAPNVTNSSVNLLNADGTVPGGQAIVISGSNFGPLNSVPDFAYLTYTGFGNSYQSALASCYVSTAFLQITCASGTPGVGTNLSLTVSFGGQAVTALTFNYVAPTLVSLGGIGAIGGSTAGGQLVTLSGLNFGPPCGSTNNNPCPYIVASYTKNSTSISGHKIVYTPPQCAVLSQTAIVCSMAPGTGADHVWSLAVAGQACPFDPNVPTTSYGAPVISKYAGPGSNDAVTQGGQVIIIEGSNFGPVGGAPVTAVYGNRNLNPDEFVALTCLVVNDHTNITCVTNEGAGNELSWTLFIDGQLGHTELTSYGVPQLQQVNHTSVLDSEGGDVLLITGLDLGVPGQNFLQSVTYGPVSLPGAYVPQCYVSDYTAIICTTLPGIGNNLVFVATVQGQTSPSSAFSLSYQAPDLSGGLIAITSQLRTAGGGVVAVAGLGYARCDVNTAHQIVVEQGDTLTTSVLQAIVLDGNGLRSFVCPGDQGVAQSQLQFSLPEMQTSRTNYVSVRLANSLLGITVSSATQIPITYADPVLETLYAESIALYPGYTFITLQGDNFCNSETCCQTYFRNQPLAALASITVPSQGIITHSHTRIYAKVLGTGPVFVSCTSETDPSGFVSTQAISFTSNSPLVLGVQTHLGTKVDVEDPSSRWSTLGGQVIEVWGMFFGTDLVELAVMVNGTSWPITSSTVQDCKSPNRPKNMNSLSFAASDVCFMVLVTTLPGSGRSLPIVVQQGVLLSQPAQPWEFFSYDFATVTPMPQLPQAGEPTTGLDSLQLTGINFGPLQGVVLIGSSLQCVVSSWVDSPSGSSLVCQIPPGEGNNLNITVVQFGVDPSSAPPTGFLLSYRSPSITSVSQNLLRTQGGDLVYISGAEFGRPFPGNGSAFSPTGPRVTINGLPCIVVQSNFSSIKCTAPEGQGTSLPVVVTVGGQLVQATQTVSYAAPVVYSVSPSIDIPTTAMSANASGQLAPIVLTVVGDNFGPVSGRLTLSIGDLTSLYQRYSDPINEVYVNQFLLANHTVMQVYAPVYYGANRALVVTQGGGIGGVTQQVSNADVTISYKEPVIGSVYTTNLDGTLSPPYDANAGVLLPDQAFNASSPLGLAQYQGSSRRLSSLVTSYGYWTTRNFSITCQSNITMPNVFWESSIIIAPNGEYAKTVNHFDYGSGQCFAEELSEVVIVKGLFYDQGVSPVMPCGGRLYEESIASVTVTVISETALSNIKSNCPCNGALWAIDTTVDITNCVSSKSQCSYFASLYQGPGQRYGTYVISDSTDMYMTPSDASYAVHAARTNLRIPDYASASVNLQTSNLQPTGPTDGCYQWESLSDYLIRSAAVAAETGRPASSVPRDCLVRALMQLSGSDFGVDLTEATDPVRIFLADLITGARYEAATLQSPGDQAVACPLSDCLHTSDTIKFWIPPGMGKGLQIQLQVGNQVVASQIRFSYLPPAIEQINPGSAFRFLPFQDADGAAIVISGSNFGGSYTNSSVFINGRPCLNSTWNSGAQTDSQGRAFLTCVAQKDVVGPRGVVICVANQAFVFPVYRSDGPVLVAGESAGAWLPGSSTNSIVYHRELKSMSISQCPVGGVGQLYELCHECPVGAVCANSSFALPAAAVNYYQSDINVYSSPSVLNPIAVANCDDSTWDPSFTDDYPDLVQRPTCSAYLACEPASSCTGNNTCAQGYEYAIYDCMNKRGYQSRDAWQNYSAYDANITDNACGVYLDPYTLTWQGNDQDCRKNTAQYSTCTSDHPEDCSSCHVLVDNSTQTRYGVCGCSLPPRCALCTLHQYYLLNNKCQPCPSNPILLIAMLLLAALVVVLVAYYLAKKNINLAFLTIGIDYFQILAIFSTTQVTWPPIIEALFQALRVFNFSIDIAAPQCLAPNFSFATEWWIQELLPFAVLAILLVIHVVFSIYKWQKWGKAASSSTHVGSLIAIFVISMYFLYLVLTKEAMTVFDCNPILNPSTGLATDPYQYTTFTDLSCDGGGRCRCNVPGGLQQSLVPPAAFFLAIYTAGFPIFIFWALRTNSRLVIEDQYLRARGVGRTRETNPDCYDVRKKYARLYYQFKPRFAPFWILVLIARKFWVAFAALMFRGSPSYQLAVILLVLFAGIVMQVLWRPFMSTGEYPLLVKELDALAERSISEPQFVVFREIQTRVEMAVRLEVKFQRRIVQRRQKGFSFLNDESAVDSEGKPKPLSRATQARVAAARYLADLNFLEFFLLGCSILICLAGIMFEAALQDTRSIIQYQANVITILVIIVISLSFIYYFLFLLAEVTPEFISAMIEIFRKNKDLPQEKEEYDDPDVQLQENPVFSRPKTTSRADQKALESEIAQSLEVLQATEHQNKVLREELKAQKLRAELAAQGGDIEPASPRSSAKAAAAIAKPTNLGDFAASKAKKKLAEEKPARAIRKRESVVARAMAYLSSVPESPKGAQAQMSAFKEDDEEEEEKKNQATEEVKKEKKKEDALEEDEDEDEVEN